MTTNRSTIQHPYQNRRHSTPLFNWFFWFGNPNSMIIRRVLQRTQSRELRVYMTIPSRICEMPIVALKSLKKSRRQILSDRRIQHFLDGFNPLMELMLRVLWAPKLSSHVLWCIKMHSMPCLYDAPQGIQSPGAQKTLTTQLIITVI